MNTHSVDPVTNIITQSYFGDQTYESMKSMIEKTEESIKELRAQNKRVLILTNIEKMQHIDNGAKKAGVEALSSIRFDKLALVGATFSLPVILETLLVPVTQDRVAIFENNEKAIAWLQQK